MCKEHLGFDYCFDEDYCKLCRGFCCIGDGFVFLTQDDIVSIANFLNCDIEEFLRIYTRKFYDKTVLANIEVNGIYMCCFLENGLCQIYPKRPTQCKTFPFWDSMKDLNIEELKTLCPAIKPIKK